MSQGETVYPQGICRLEGSVSTDPDPLVPMITTRHREDAIASRGASPGDSKRAGGPETHVQQHVPGDPPPTLNDGGGGEHAAERAGRKAGKDPASDLVCLHQ